MPRISILLAEDNQRVMSAIKEMLESEGWIVATAENGKIALQKLEGGDR